MYVCLHNESMAEKWAKHHTGHIMATKQLSAFFEKKKREKEITAATSKVPDTKYNMSVGLMTVKMEIET